MSKFINISSATTTTLVQPSSSATRGVNSKAASNNYLISSIYIANNHTDNADATLFVENIADASIDYVIFKNVVIPPKTTFVWEHPFSFNIKKHTLKLTTVGTTSATVIIN